MFYGCKKAFQSTTTISIPRPSDSPVLTVDASSVISSLEGTFIIQHDTGHHVAGFFNFKLMEHQRNWLPCEFEAFTIAAVVSYFVPYICESHHPRQILSESKPYVEHTKRFSRVLFLLLVGYLHFYLHSVCLMYPYIPFHSYKSFAMSFLNQIAWRSAQHNCPDLCCPFAHLSQGATP